MSEQIIWIPKADNKQEAFYVDWKIYNYIKSLEEKVSKNSINKDKLDSAISKLAIIREALK